MYVVHPQIMGQDGTELKISMSPRAAKLARLANHTTSTPRRRVNWIGRFARNIARHSLNAVHDFVCYESLLITVVNGHRITKDIYNYTGWLKCYAKYNGQYITGGTITVPPGDT